MEDLKNKKIYKEVKIALEKVAIENGYKKDYANLIKVRYDIYQNLIDYDITENEEDLNKLTDYVYDIYMESETATIDSVIRNIKTKIDFDELSIDEITNLTDDELLSDDEDYDY